MNTTADERLVVMLEARVSEFEKRMRQAEGRGTRTYQGLRRGSQSATRQMETDMIRASGRIDQALAGISGKVGAFGKAFAGGLVAGASAAVLGQISTNIRGIVGDLSNMAKEADRVGISLDWWQALERGFGQAGVQANEFTAAMTTFTARIGEAAGGSGQLHEALSRNGIRLRSANGELRSTIDLLRDYANVIGRAGSEAERVRLVEEGFGRGGRSLANALQGGSAALEGFMRAARDGGHVIEENLIRQAEVLDDRFDDLTRRISVMWKSTVMDAAEALGMIDTLKNRFGSDEFARAVLGSGTFEELKNNLALIADKADEIRDVRASFLALDVEISALLPELVMMAAELDRIGQIGAADVLRGWITSMEETRQGFVRGTVSAETFEGKVRHVRDGVTDMVKEMAGVDQVDFSRVTARIGVLSAALDTARRIAGALRASLPGGQVVEVPGYLDSLDQSPSPWRPSPGAPAGRPRSAPAELGFEPVTAGGGGKGKGDSFARSVEQIREQTRALEAEAVALVAAAAGGQAFGDAVDYARKRAELLNAAMKAGKQVTPELEAEIDALARAYVTAGLNAQEAADRLKRVEESGRAGAQAIGDIFGSVLDGTKSAKDAVRELLMQMAKVQMMKAVFGLGKTGGALGGLFGALGQSLTMPSFDGGGHTGNAPRSGGLDGKGGFLAMMHPRETVTDHTRRQAAPAAQAQALTVTVIMDPSTAQLGAFVRDQAGRVVAQAAPMIIGQSVQATYERAREVPLP